MDKRLECLSELEQFKKIKRAAEEKKTCAVFGVDEQKPYFTALLSELTGRKLFIVVPNEADVVKTQAVMNRLTGKSLSFPTKDYNFRTVESVSRFDENRRIETVAAIRKKDFSSVVIPAEALCTLVMPPEDYRELTIRPSDTFEFDKMAETLISFGYERFNNVTGQGQFGIRGGIVDIFPPSESQPYRIEFWDNEVDTVSLFDVNTQRRTEPADGVRITPAKEYRAEIAEKILERIKPFEGNKYADEDEEKLKSGILPKHDRWLPACYGKAASILDYADNDTTVVFFEYNACLEAVKGFSDRLHEDIKALTEEGYPFLNAPYCFDKESVIAKLGSPIVFETLPRSMNDLTLDELAEIKLFPTTVANTAALQEDVLNYLDAEYSVFVVAANGDHAKELRKEFGNDTNLDISTGDLPWGFVCPEKKTAVFSFGQKKQIKRPPRSRFKRGETIKDFSDINVGDYVVHVNYGIGIYDGIHKVESGGIINDYIRLKFAGTDVLYFPCSQLDQISKYTVGDSGVKVKLNKLGGNEWQKTKTRVKHSVKDLAKQLIALYDTRRKIKGHAFSPDTELQKDFEALFEFEETEDQTRSIAEIKKDMESDVPMDRLLCGDVGFGKTEVAIRAIFKCVCDNYQVAFLAPTTILAFQHYQTLIKRIGDYPISVELLSRFRTPTQQKKILEGVKNGKIEILVGTHRMLQKDVRFKKLGLIVVDEEQRFGVAHKEHLKELSKSADVLTLSATPIPRTLNMSMSGIRDISVLNEAPQNRYPVTTYVAEYDVGIIVDAIKREVARGGQCFYLHNRIDTIYKTANMLYEKTGFRIQVAHGKMSQEDLSEIWTALVEGQIDVLVCTTIIETGVDVPNCNTLIIEDADRLGLAQLHQIRGRVGRSDRRAYAYFTFRKGKTLSSDAYKRLMTIREFTEFGSGLKIAMRDLEIRGAGNVLGAEQSGHMMTVGFDMYMKLLEDAVAEERGETVATRDCAVDIKVNAYIPDTYIRDMETRVEIYKLIAGMTDDGDESEIIDELIDRFGEPPREVMALIEISKVRMLGVRCGVPRIEQKDNTIIVYLDSQPDWDAVSEVSAAFPKRVFYTPAQKPYFTLKTTEPIKDVQQFLVKLSLPVDKRAEE